MSWALTSYNIDPKIVKINTYSKPTRPTIELKAIEMLIAWAIA